MRFILLALTILAAAAKEQHRVSRDPTQTRLNYWPMIFSHDAGSTYMPTSIVDGVEQYFTTAVARTQTGSLLDQVKCGARAFDIRPYLKADGTLVFHHGSAIAELSTMYDALKEVVEWNAENPDELILLHLFSCDTAPGATSYCDKEADNVLTSLGVKTVSRSKLYEDVVVYAEDGTESTVSLPITVDAAMRISTGKRGTPFATKNAIASTYNTMELLGECYLATTLGDLIDLPRMLTDEDPLWKPGDPATDFNLDDLKKITNNVLDVVGSIPIGTTCWSEPGKWDRYADQREIWDSYATMDIDYLTESKERPLWKVDGHWQYSTESVVMMFIFMSSHLWDSERSQQNYNIAQQIKKGSLINGGNLIGMDHVCTDGLDVYEALQATLFEKESIFSSMSVYFKGFAKGLVRGEKEYTIPVGVLVGIFAMLACFWGQKMCVDGQSMRDSLDDKSLRQGGGGYTEAFMMKNGKFKGQNSEKFKKDYQSKMMSESFDPDDKL